MLLFNLTLGEVWDSYQSDVSSVIDDLASNAVILFVCYYFSINFIYCWVNGISDFGDDSCSDAEVVSIS